MRRFDGAVSELEKSVKRLMMAKKGRHKVRWVKIRKKILKDMKKRCDYKKEEWE